MNKQETSGAGRLWSFTDHGDHVTAGAVHPDGPWVSIIAQPQRAMEGHTVWQATAWVHGTVEGSSRHWSTVADALQDAFDDTCASACLGGGR